MIAKTIFNSKFMGRGKSNLADTIKNENQASSDILWTFYIYLKKKALSCGNLE